MSLLCTELHVKVHQKVQQLTQWKENITFIWHLSEHLISLSPHPERALANIWEYLGNFVLRDVIKIVFSDQSLVKTNNQYRLNMHQTQSFLENQTNISRILLGSFIRKTSEEKLFCLSQHVLSAWSINLSVIGYSTDSTRWLGFSLKVYLHISWLLSEIGQTTEFWSGMKLEASGASGWWLHSNLAATLVQVVSTWTQNTGVTWEAEGDTELNTGKSNDFWIL